MLGLNMQFADTYSGLTGGCIWGIKFKGQYSAVTETGSQSKIIDFGTLDQHQSIHDCVFDGGQYNMEVIGADDGSIQNVVIDDVSVTNWRCSG
jgi:hypothetical protein